MSGVRWLCYLIVAIAACASVLSACTEICTPYQVKQVSCPQSGVGWFAKSTCAADGCSWTAGACEFDCKQCPAAGACRISACTQASGCAYSYAVQGSSCGSGNVCDGNGNCIPSCTSIGGSCTPASGADPVQGFCPTGACVKCPEGTSLQNGACQTSCTPKQAAEVCSGECGAVDDGCGGILNCGGCTNGQSCIDGACVCPGVCKYDSPCSTLGVDSCGGTCARQTEGLICGVGKTCNNGQCVCTPKCEYADVCAQSTPDGCGGLCARDTSGIPCGPSSTCSGGACMQLQHMIGNVSARLDISPGHRALITPTIDVAGVTWEVSGYSTASSVPFSISASTADLGTQQPLRITASANGKVVSTFTATVHVVCLPGDDCFCRSTATQGCLENNSSSSPVNLYCQSGSCRACTPPRQIRNGACVECATDSDCHATNECITSVCVANACVAKVLVGASCSNSGVCSETGLCSQPCSQASCQKLNVARVTNSVNSTNGCMLTTTQTVAIPDYQCVGTQCTNLAPKVVLSSKNISLPDGAVCAGGSCNAGVCIVHECNTAQDCSAQSCMDRSCVENRCVYTPARNVCLGVTAAQRDAALSVCMNYVEVCGTQCEVSPLNNHACVLSTSGICKADACLTECSQTPGCMPRLRDATYKHLEPAAQACRSTGDVCYRCEQGFVFDPKQGSCEASPYLLSVATTQVKAGEKFTLKPIITSSQGQADGLFLYSLTTIQDYAPLTIFTTDKFTMSFSSPGVYPLTVFARRRATDTPVAQLATTIAVTCREGPCCEAGATRPRLNGSSCEVNGVPGVCNGLVCATSCVSTGQETGDACNNARDDDCNGLTDCRDPACSAFCPSGLICQAGEIICSSACVDVLRSNRHCGACAKQCGQGEQCIAGSCTAVEQCNIVCEDDADCLRGELCINAGDCKKSYCQQSNSVQASQEQVDAMTRTITEQKPYIVSKSIDGNNLHLFIENLAPVPLVNFSLSVSVPGAQAGEVSSSYPYSLDERGEMVFRFPQIEYSQQVTITAARHMTESETFFTTEHVFNNQQAQSIPEHDLSLTANYVESDGKTTLVLNLDPHKDFAGVLVPVDIPKCMLASASSMVATGKYNIVADDPLVVWSFEELSGRERIEVELPAAVDESCKQGLTAFAVAASSSKPLSPWLPLLAIPIVGLLIVFFQRFRSDGGAEQKMSRKEFERLALQDGVPPDQLEDEWHEYEKRF